jgi:uncharacterized protein (TIGR01777 family)
MRVAVTGATGFVGRHVVDALLKRGDRVVALGRDPESMEFPPSVGRRRFDPSDHRPQPEAFESVGAVIHLAGETISGRWTQSKKTAIRDSRTIGTSCLVASLEACDIRPTVLVSASAVGYYGSRGDEPLFECSPAGDGFLANVCRDWENAAMSAERLGIRTVCLRTAMVLGRDGGGLAAMMPPFRAGLGGPLGSGRQFTPWIHIDDLVALYLFALDNNDVRGGVNAVAPDYATSARFAQALGAALHRPALIPAPAFALKALLGEFSSVLLGSQLVIPALAEDAGFTWGYGLLEAAVAQAAGSKISAPYGVSVFESTQTVPAKRDDVFKFFSSPHNLEAITPPALRFAVTKAPHSIDRGSLISYTLRLHGVPMNWKTLIARWGSHERFVDVQLHGPYALWRHEHIFRDVPGGTELTDRVSYALPFAPFGALVKRFVREDIERIFAFRRSVIAERFAPSTSS